MRFERAKRYAGEHASEIVDCLAYVDEKTIPCVWIFGDTLQQIVAWFQLQDRLWLEVTMLSDDWPGLACCLVWWEDDDFRNHLMTHCAGWYVRENRGSEYLKSIGVEIVDFTLVGFADDENADDATT